MKKRQKQLRKKLTVSLAALLLLALAIFMLWDNLGAKSPPNPFSYVHDYYDCVRVLNHPRQPINGHTLPKHSGLYNESTCDLDILGWGTQSYDLPDNSTKR